MSYKDLKTTCPLPSKLTYIHALTPGHQSPTGFVPCYGCGPGAFTRFDNVTLRNVCEKCSSDLPSTLTNTSTHENACYFAEVGVDRVWFSGSRVQVQVFWR